MFIEHDIDWKTLVAAAKSREANWPYANFVKPEEIIQVLKDLHDRGIQVKFRSFDEKAEMLTPLMTGAMTPFYIPMYRGTIHDVPVKEGFSHIRVYLGTVQYIHLRKNRSEPMLTFNPFRCAEIYARMMSLPSDEARSIELIQQSVCIVRDRPRFTTPGSVLITT